MAKKTIRVKYAYVVTSVPTTTTTDADHNSIRLLIKEETSRYKKPTRA